jgi:hypothetical protein
MKELYYYITVPILLFLVAIVMAFPSYWLLEKWNSLVGWCEDYYNKL